jgi:hypothetical protein
MRRVPPGRHVLVVRDPNASAGDESSQASADELPPATSHRYAEWDFSGVPDSMMFRQFLDTTDYWFGYSDDSSAGSYDPARECCVVITSNHANAADAAEAGNGEVPIGPGTGLRMAVGPSAPPPSPLRGADINAQLAQARELEAKLAEEYCTVRLLRASIAGEASARSERARELGKQARDRINANFNVDDPDTPPRASQKLIAVATLLQAMPAPSTPEARNLHREAQALIEQATVQQAESSASRIRQQGSAWDNGGAQGPEPSVHMGGVPERPTNLGRTLAKERLLDTRRQAQDGDARNVINARRAGNTETRAAAGYHPRRGGRYDSWEDRSPTPEPPGTRVFSREIRTAIFPQRFRQPTSIVKYNGETDPRVWLNDYRLACQLGGATTDEVIICNLPLHLADSARTWLEHLPASRIHNWDDLVRTFVGNFQGTYVRPGNSWDLRSCTQKPGESLRDFIRRFSKRCTDLPSVAQSEIVHAFLKGTTCQDLVRELGRSPPVDSNELFDIATSFASGEEAVGAIFDGKKGKCVDDAAAEGSKSKEPRQKNKMGKKGKKPHREAREQGHDDDDGEALAVDPARRGPRPDPRGHGVFDDMLKKPCPYHKMPVNHTLEQCDMLRQFYGRATAKDGEAKRTGVTATPTASPLWKTSSLSSGGRPSTCPAASVSGSGTRSLPQRRHLPPSSTGRRTPSRSAVRITRTASPTRVSTRWWSTQSSVTPGSRRS